MVDAMCKEIAIRADDLATKKIDTIYLGGGTPSILSIDQLSELFTAMATNFDLDSVLEVTLECNPDDITEDYLNGIKEIGITRISLGVQSIFKTHLDFMARNHDEQDVHNSLKLLSQHYADNYTIDLIYGVPNMTNDDWKDCLETIIDYRIPHFSAYALTIEEKTQLNYLINSGKVEPMDDETYWTQFKILQDFCDENGFEAYEISNFAKPQKRAIHNSNYWRGEPYLGIGPSAHSFSNNMRSWNVSNNAKYINGLDKGQRVFDQETLSERELFNEYVMTHLRMMEGVLFDDVLNKFGRNFLDFLKSGLVSLPSKKEWINETDMGFSLTTEGRFASDHITRELIMV